MLDYHKFWIPITYSYTSVIFYLLPSDSYILSKVKETRFLFHFYLVKIQIIFQDFLCHQMHKTFIIRYLLNTFP